MVESTTQQMRAEYVKGIFSKEVDAVIGSGASRRKVKKMLYFFAEEIEGGKIEVRNVNANMLPYGSPETSNLAEFIKKYKPEPEIYQTKTLPALRELTKTLAKAERLRKQGEPYTAEVEFQKVLTIDEHNARGAFGLGLTYLDRGDTEKAAEVLKRIVKIEDAFSIDNKHMFNEFGIKLRKNKMYDQALAYYASAYQNSRGDENLLYNIARTLYEKEDYENGLKYINKALEINPSFEEGLQLKSIFERKFKKTSTG